VHQLRELFDIYDKDGSGYIDRAEMLAAMRAMHGLYLPSPPASPQALSRAGHNAQPDALDAEARDMIISVDGVTGPRADGSGTHQNIRDGEISFEEFLVLLGPAFEEMADR
jgi:Ca2+-binding EF-hand superfamily protein